MADVGKDPIPEELREHFGKLAARSVAAHLLSSDAPALQIEESVLHWVRNRFSALTVGNPDWETVFDLFARCAIVAHLGLNSEVAARIVSEVRSQEQELIELYLVLRAKQNDSDAFGELWLQFEDQLRGCVRVRCRRIPFDEAEDYLNWLYIQIHRDLRHYRPERARFLAFLRNRAELLQGRYRKETDTQTTLPTPSPGPDNLDELGSDIPDTSPDPLEDLIEAERRRKIEHLLREAFAMPSPPHQLIVFGLNRLLGWKPRQIVQQLWVCPLSVLLQALATHNLEAYNGEIPIRDLLGELERKMELTLDETLKHGRTRKIFGSLGIRVVIIFF